MTDHDTPRSREERDEREPPRKHPAREFRLVVVEYTDQPSQCTVVPRGLDREDLLSTWLTADRSDCLDLETYR